MNKLTILMTLLSCFSVPSQADPFQAHASIFTAARNFIERQFDATIEHEVTFLPLDSRLQLSDCERPLEAFSAKQTITPGRNAIGVKCTSNKSWSLYVTAQVKVYQDVVALTHTIKRGEILSENQLTTTKMDTSQLKSAFVTNKDLAINKQAAHNLLQGAILYERDLTPAILIKRGENVVICSKNPYISIQMQGLALMDGALGQSIKVKNTTSSRVISATVTKQGVVSVDF